ncbi:MAG: thiamine pyrophosphate-binding protein [Pseudomonadota bacterium]
MRTGGELIVDCLKAQGVDRIFCVPGESYLAVLDGLHESGIEIVNARHEGGAAIMAEADGKITGRPGIAMVTRGPGATNAAAGVHIAKQDSTPMILFVGQIGREMRGREAFQEVDYRQTFCDLAKWVEEIDDADRIPEIVNHAYHIAMSGRPGPVVLALPEDMLRDKLPARSIPYVEAVEPAPSQRDMERFEVLLNQSANPFLVLGGSRWTSDAVEHVHRFAERFALPVGCSFRRQHLFDAHHPNYAGDVGLGINPMLKERIAGSDLVILLGCRFSENPSQNFSLLGFPDPGKPLVHIHPGAEELGRIYTPTLALNATPGTFLEACETLSGGRTSEAPKEAHQDYLSWTNSIPIPESPGFASTGAIMAHLRDRMDDHTIIANGAGNYAIWLHRFWRYREFGTQLAPTSGSMGYGLPAAITGQLRHPERRVICLAGDGCFQMTGQEFATAVQAGTPIVVIVIDNTLYGTIRMHQERDYPTRVTATEIQNPDFAALARAYGGHGETVTADAAFPEALNRALAADVPAIVHVKTDPDILSPNATISGLREKSV